MANTGNRTLYEILELFFCTTTKAEFFADDNFRNIEVERIKTFVKYIDSYNNDTYQNILSTIPTDKEFLENNYPSYFLWLNQGSKNADVGVIERNIFDIREKELQKLKEVLLGFIKNKNIDNHQKENIYKGFYYKDRRKLRKFYISLCTKGYILCDFEAFSRAFEEEFEPNEKKILWLGQLSLLNYMIKKIRKDEKFKCNYKYTEIVPLLFEFRDKKGMIKALDIKTFSQNSDTSNISTSQIDNALRELE